MMFRSILRTLIVICFASVAGVAGQQTNSLSSEQQQLLTLLNGERVRHGFKEVMWNDQLYMAAVAHAQLMAQRAALSHGFAGEAVLGDRLGITGLRFNLAAENLAAGPTIWDIHNGLMASTVHRSNILEEKYNSVAIAIVFAGGKLYVVQDFAHVLPSYSESDFRDSIVAAVNKLRDDLHAPRLKVEDDARLREAACRDSDAATVAKDILGASDVVVFTSSIPEKLPQELTDAVPQKEFKTLSLGVCFTPGKAHGYATFIIVAVFTP